MTATGQRTTPTVGLSPTGVYDTRLAFLTDERATSHGVDPRDDYLAEFPFLACRTLRPPRWTSVLRERSFGR
jgi:hypothetical protein